MTTSMERWDVVNRFPALLHFFRQVAEVAGISVTDTGEEFTCRVGADHMAMEPGIAPDVQFVLHLKRLQIDRLADVVATGSLTDIELYRIVREVFTPAAVATLHSPIVRNPYLRKLSGVEDLIHVRLISPVPDEEPDTVHTIFYANRQWLAIPGLWGVPARVFELSVAEALEYHRRVTAAGRTDSLTSWLAFTRWYQGWRRGVSHKAA